MPDPDPSSRGGERAAARAFPDFYQFICTTRVIAGRGLIDQAGFEFAKEGADRVLLVTDEVIRATGLADRVGAGVRDGGLELVGDFGCTLVNPREPTEEDFATLYRRAL